MEEAFVSAGVLSKFSYHVIKDSRETVTYANNSLLRDSVLLAVIVKLTFAFLAVEGYHGSSLSSSAMKRSPSPCRQVYGRKEQ